MLTFPDEVVYNMCRAYLYYTLGMYCCSRTVDLNSLNRLPRIDRGSSTLAHTWLTSPDDSVPGTKVEMLVVSKARVAFLSWYVGMFKHRSTFDDDGTMA